jgi:aspartokinase/homoserine dehydrogenase 1
VAAIIEGQLDLDKAQPQSTNLAAVVSAMGGNPKVTDLLLSAVQHASTRNTTRWQKSLGLSLTSTRSEQERLLNIIEGDLEEIRDILKTVSIMKWNPERISEVVSGYGELWSSQVLSALTHKRSSKKVIESWSESYIHHNFVKIEWDWRCLK